MYRSFKERSSQQGCVGFGSAAQVSHFPTLGLSPVIQVSGEEAIAPLDSVLRYRRPSSGNAVVVRLFVWLRWQLQSRASTELRRGFVRPFRGRNLADQLEIFCTEFTIDENSSIFRFVNGLIFSDLQVATGLHR